MHMRSDTDAAPAGDKNDHENLRYCLYGKALVKEWMPAKVKQDILTGDFCPEEVTFAQK